MRYVSRIPFGKASKTEPGHNGGVQLFVDLLYVGIIEVNGESAAEHPSGAALLRFCITFILGWKIWTDFTLTISWFESGMACSPVKFLRVITR